MQTATKTPSGWFKNLGPVATVAIFALSLGILDLAFLITFALVKNCSPTNIAVFLGFFYADVVLALVGVSAGFLGLRKTRYLRTLGALLLVIYISLIFLMLRMITA